MASRLAVLQWVERPPFNQRSPAQTCMLVMIYSALVSLSSILNQRPAPALHMFDIKNFPCTYHSSYTWLLHEEAKYKCSCEIVDALAVIGSLSSSCQLTECWVLQKSHTAGVSLNSTPPITDKHENTRRCQWASRLWWMDRCGDPVTESVIAHMEQPGADGEISLNLWMIDHMTRRPNHCWSFKERTL